MAGFSAEYSEAHDLTLFVGQGRLSAENFLSAMKTHYTAHPSSLAIWDVSQADLSDLDMAALMKISESARSTAKDRGDPRNLIVVAQEQEAFLIRLYQRVAEVQGSPIRYEIFYRLAEAYRALGIDDPFAEKRDTA